MASSGRPARLRSRTPARRGYDIGRTPLLPESKHSSAARDNISREPYNTSSSSQRCDAPRSASTPGKRRPAHAPPVQGRVRVPRTGSRTSIGAFGNSRIGAVLGKAAASLDLMDYSRGRESTPCPSLVSASPSPSPRCRFPVPLVGATSAYPSALCPSGASSEGARAVIDPPRPSTPSSSVAPSARCRRRVG